MTSEYSSPEFRARFTAQARQAAALSDLVIAVSHFTAVQVRSLLGVAADRIRVIHHGVHIHTPSNTPRENLVLCLGAIQKRKNIARLVKAFERLPNSWRLALAGAPDGYGAIDELKAVEQSPRRADIDVLGYVDASTLASLYQRARIFAFPSLDEGFGMPVLEAMSHGIPVVTSNRSSLPEVAGDAALLVDPRNVDEIGEALLRFALDEDLHAEFSRRGIERTQQFTWPAAVEKTWQVYTEIR